MTNPLRELIKEAEELNDGGGLRAWLVDNSLRIADLIDAAQDVVSKESNMQYSELSDDCDDLHAALAKLTEGK